MEMWGKKVGDCCYKCEKRHLNCHATCKERKEAPEIEAERQKKIAAYRRENAFSNFGNYRRWHPDRPRREK